jgi:DNA-binding IclR family transcriptional regulator
MEQRLEHRAATIEKAVDVLFHLHEARRPCGVSEVGRALGLPKSTAHRLLAALRGRRLVDRDASGRYRPGIALAALGLGVLSSEPLVAAARSVLEAEAAAGGETVFLAGARGGRLLVLDKEEGSSFLRASPRVGEEVPAGSTAVGKLHLALAPERLSDGPEVAASMTPELSRVRTRGWATNRDEWISGLSGVAAPILLDGALVGAVAIAGPSARIQVDAKSPFVHRVCAAAERVGARLAGKAGEPGA